MKKSIIAILLACTLLMVGCGSQQADTKEVATEETDVNEASTSEESTVGEDASAVESATESEDTSSESATLSGTWETVSNGYEYNGEIQPEYYVQFTENKVNYGHMKDGEFELEYSDDISDVSTVSDGLYRVQAVTADGAQYTYQTSESDGDTLEYYGTWNEEEYGDTYSGSSSLVRTSITQ